MEEKRRKHEGFHSRGKEGKRRVWNEGTEEKLSREKASAAVLLEERKNELRALGKFSHGARSHAHALNSCSSLVQSLSKGRCHLSKKSK